jgi:hypothetical protein
MWQIDNGESSSRALQGPVITPKGTAVGSWGDSTSEVEDSVVLQHPRQQEQKHRSVGCWEKGMGVGEDR